MAERNEGMRVLFTGGGTAGHINPALAAAGYLKQMHGDAEILFVGNQGGMEERLVPPAGYPIKTIRISGFQRKLTPKNLAKNVKTVFRLFSSSQEARRIIREFAPDLCMGTGGYVSGPVIREAAKLGVPCVVHESNAFPGVTIKMLAKQVDTVMLCGEAARKYFDEGVHVEITGNPVRPEFLNVNREAARKALGLDNRPLILSVGGSLGSARLNEAMVPLLKRSALDGKYQHIHGYGYGKDNTHMLEQLRQVDLKKASHIKVLEYISNIPECMAAADLIISRSGAMTVTELQTLGKAAVLIPSPNVAENHQFHNAMALVEQGAADILEEKDLTPEALMEKVDAILGTAGKAEEIGKKAGEMAIHDVNERIYSVMMRAVKRGKK